ncbi:MAG: flagellar M-ring protein FliF [Desulfobulbus propionicus]|nr:MAG: flagellar M-ring protein FliF [Desulfobulbus propionicus]
MAKHSFAEPTTSSQNGLVILANRIRNWSLGRQLALAAVLLLTIGLFSCIIMQGRTADYQLLYGDLSEPDMTSTLQWLKGKNIPYRLTDNGHSVMIPANNVDNARLGLAAVGLPRGGDVGFEIFDEQSFSPTDFMQKINYGRALQGELARTIASLGPVESARVHLDLPENQEKNATASVILKLTAGRRLRQSQMEGILHLVSSSIGELTPENVTVIDQNGNVLSAQKGAYLSGSLSPDIFEYQLQMERSLEHRAQALLDKAIGPKKSMVRVTAMLDFTRTEKTEELFDPEEPVIRSEQISEEKSATEVASAVADVQANPQENTTSARPPSNRSQRKTNYEISKVVSHTVSPVGTIQRLSVSVLVTDKSIPAKDDTPASTEPRSEKELLALETMIASALGLDKTRGDRIEVTSMPFEEPQPEKELTDLSPSPIYRFMPLIKYGLLFFAGLLVYFLLVRPLIRTLRDDVTQHFKTVQEIEEEARQKAQVEKEVQAMFRDPVQRVLHRVEKNPLVTAYVLKGWLHEKS